MARNGSGTYSLPAGNPVTTGTTISSTWANNTLNDLGSAMTASLAYDGQTVPVANLPMGGYLHTNVGNATVRTNYAAAGQVQDGTLQYLTSISGTNTVTGSAPISMTAYAAGQTFRFIVATTNTGSTTLNINSIGAKSITKNGTTSLSAGDLLINSVVEVIYDGTQFQLINPIAATSQAFPSGTRMSFQQTSAPTGWTKDTTAGINDSAMRLVTGSVVNGGSVAFTTAFASQTPAGSVSVTSITGTAGATTLTTSQIPSHDHTYTLGTSSLGATDGATGSKSTTSATTGATGGSASHTHSFSFSSGSATFSGTAINLAVKYYDFIIATAN